MLEVILVMVLAVLLACLPSVLLSLNQHTDRSEQLDKEIQLLQTTPLVEETAFRTWKWDAEQ